MKKLIGIFLGIFLILGVFASGAKEEEKSKSITINYWTHEDPNRNTLEDRFVKEFEEKYPNVKIVKTVHASNKMNELVQTAFAANQGPDIFNLALEDGYSYIANARVAALDPKYLGLKETKEITDTYLDNMLDPVIENDKIYGLPLELNNWCIFINKRIFKEVGLDPEKDYPKTWEEMADISDKLAIRDGQILKRRGFDFRYPYYLVGIVPMIEQLGGSLISEDGKKAIVNDEAWLKFFEYMKAWGPNGRNLGSPTYKNARKLFNMDDNTISMTLTGLYQEARILADNPDFYNSMEWMVVPFPVFKDAINDRSAAYYGQYFMVNEQNTEYEKEMSWKFVNYMLSHSIEYLEKVSIIQPTKTLMNSQEFKDKPYSNIFVDDLKRSNIVYYGANSSRIQKLLREAIEGVMLSNVEPREALDALRSKVQELLDE